jgi:multidrug efflux pump subunit AcrB
MKKNIIQICIEKKLLVLCIILMSLLGGIYSYYALPKQNFPEAILPATVITAIYPGASPEEMEELVTKKIEELALESDGFDTSSSQTYNSVSVVTIQLDTSYSQQQIKDSLDTIRRKLGELKENDLPSGVTSVTMDTEIMDTAGLMVAVTAEGISGDELASRANQVKELLKDVKGVQRVEVTGQRESSVRIVVQPEKLNQLNLSLAELMQMIEYQNSTIPAGTIEIEGQKIVVDTSGAFENLQEIQKIVVGQVQTTGEIITLNQVADITFEQDEKLPKYLYNGEESVLVSVYFEPGKNILTIGEDVKKVLQELREELPPFITLNEVYFQSEVVEKAIDDFTLNLLQAIAIVIIVVMLGMNFRNGIVVSLTIPLSICMVFIAMLLSGYDIQFVSLAALIVVLGMLVDNAIVVSDAIQVRLDEGEERKAACINGTKEVAVPVFASMLTTVVSFLSLLSLEGTYRQISISLPFVVIVGLVASYIVSMLITPLMASIFLKPGGAKTKEGKLKRHYEKAFGWIFNHKLLVLVCVAVFMFLGAGAFNALQLELLPKANKDVIMISLTADDEDNIEKTEELVRQISDILENQPEVSYYFAGVGLGLPRYDFAVFARPSINNVGDIFVRIDLSDSDQFKYTSQMVEYLQQKLAKEIVGGTIIVDELGIASSGGAPIMVRLYSDDLDLLSSASEEVQTALVDIPGTLNVSSNRSLSKYNYYVEMNTNKLSSLGLTKAEVQNELNILLSGREASIFRKGGKEYSIFVEGEVNSLSALSHFKIKSSATNEKYPLSQFAETTVVSQMTSIGRIDGKRGITVSAYNDASYSPITIQKELQRRIDALDLPKEIKVEMWGDSSVMDEIMEKVLVAGIVSLGGIMLILIAQFNSIKQALLVFISLPFGVVGGFIALLLAGQKLSFFAIIGMISLLGIVVNNAIVLIDYINAERLRGIGVDEACKRAASKRFRPIMLSTITTTLGLVPLALSDNFLFKPLAVLVMFGLIVSTVFTLVLIPMVYSLIMKKDNNAYSQTDQEATVF